MHLLLKCTIHRNDMRQNLHVVRLHVFSSKYIVKIYLTFYKKCKIIKINPNSKSTNNNRKIILVEY